jgi:hypothetical protein
MEVRIAGRLSRWWSQIRSRVMRAPHIVILLAGATFVVIYSFPGYMNYDSAEQLRQGRVGLYDDWHPPLMARYWHVIEKVMTGPLPLLFLQTTLFLWGLHGILKRRFQPRTAAVLTVVILLFPPVIATFAPVWKDSQMVAFILAGVMLMLGESRRARIVGGVLLFFAAGVRDNACTTLPPLLLFVVAQWGFRRKVVVGLVAFALWCVITAGARGANVQLADKDAHAWAKANAILDIAGMICMSKPMTDEEILRDLDGVLLLEHGPDLQKRFCEQYWPRWWFPLSFHERALFSIHPDQADVDAREAAFFRLLRRDPMAFVKHRWNVSKELLGLGETPPDEPVCQTFTGSDDQAAFLRIADRPSYLQRRLGSFYKKLSVTPLFRPWLYGVVGLIFFVYACWKRDGLVMALVASGFLYETTFLVAAAGAPFRYSNWLILCVCISAVIIFGERLRDGIAARQKAGTIGSR